MNARTIRRAQERQARKQSTPVGTTLSTAQLEANRENAQLSTGPRTEAGKTKSSLNAVTTGLTGKTVLLATDDAAQYQAHLQSHFDDWQPVTPRELELVQSMADTKWRIYRIPYLEMGIFALARIEFADKFQDYEPAEAAVLIQAQAFITYHKQLNNLSLQDSRLRRQFDKELKELLKLTEDRQQRVAKAKVAGHQHPPAVSAPASPAPLNGFEFSPAEIDTSESHRAAA